jgi:hypothetical protein
MAFNPSEHASIWSHPGSTAIITEGQFEQWNDMSGINGNAPVAWTGSLRSSWTGLRLPA